MLAVTRASEICIGIVCAGVVLAGTDFGGSRRQLAELFAALAAEIAGRFAGMLAQAGSQSAGHARSATRAHPARHRARPGGRSGDRESSQLRYHSPVLQRAVEGLFAALDGWRGVAAHLSRLPEGAARQEAETVLCSLPPALRSAPEIGSASTAGWLIPSGSGASVKRANRTLLVLPAGTPSQRLLADQTAKLLAGLAHALDGLTLLVDAGRPFPAIAASGSACLIGRLASSMRGRAFVTIGAVELFWVVTAWPNGALGHRVFGGRAPVALAQRRPGLRWRDGVRARRCRRRPCRGNCQVCGAAGALRRSRPFASLSVCASSQSALCGPKPATAGFGGCDRHGLQLCRGIAFEILLLLWRGFAFWTRWILRVADDSRRGRLFWIALSHAGTVWTTRGGETPRCTTFMRFWR